MKASPPFWFKALWALLRRSVINQQSMWSFHNLNRCVFSKPQSAFLCSIVCSQRSVVLFNQIWWNPIVNRRNLIIIHRIGFWNLTCSSGFLASRIQDLPARSLMLWSPSYFPFRTDFPLDLFGVLITFGSEWINVHQLESKVWSFFFPCTNLNTYRRLKSVFWHVAMSFPTNFGFSFISVIILGQKRKRFLFIFRLYSLNESYPLFSHCELIMVKQFGPICCWSV